MIPLLYHQQYSTSESLTVFRISESMLMTRKYTYFRKNRVRRWLCSQHSLVIVSEPDPLGSETSLVISGIVWYRERCCLFACCSVYCCLEWFRGVTVQEVLRLRVSERCAAAISGHDILSMYTGLESSTWLY